MQLHSSKKGQRKNRYKVSDLMMALTGESQPPRAKNLAPGCDADGLKRTRRGLWPIY